LHKALLDKLKRSTCDSNHTWEQIIKLAFKNRSSWYKKDKKIDLWEWSSGSQDDTNIWGELDNNSYNQMKDESR